MTRKSTRWRLLKKTWSSARTKQITLKVSGVNCNVIFSGKNNFGTNKPPVYCQAALRLLNSWTTVLRDRLFKWRRVVLSLAQRPQFYGRESSFLRKRNHSCSWVFALERNNISRPQTWKCDFRQRRSHKADRLRAFQACSGVKHADIHVLWHARVLSARSGSGHRP